MKSIVNSTTPETSFWPIQYTDFPGSGAPQQNRGEYKQLKAEDNEAAPRGSIEKNRGRAGGLSSKKVVEISLAKQPGDHYMHKRGSVPRSVGGGEWGVVRNFPRVDPQGRNATVAENLPRVPLFPSVLRQGKNLRLLFSTTT